MLIRVLILLGLTASYHAANYACTEDFCASYLEKNECISTSTACNIQNRTHSGEFFSAEVPCGCCSICLQNLVEGAPCTRGSPDMTPPLLVCGPGLYCKYNTTATGYTCQKMDHTKCFKEQIIYDTAQNSEQTGSFTQRPWCDGDGNYLSAKCTIGQSCFCVNPAGERIFGEAPYSPTNALTMKCECSRMVDRLKGAMEFEHPILAARCQEDGSFDPLQCMEGKCICVDPQSGSPMGESKMVTDFNYHRLPCFDPTTHLDYKYLHDCEQKQYDILQEMKAVESEPFTILRYDWPNCQPDGWFEAVQTDEDSFFCVDKYNRKIENFSVDWDTHEARDMNCKCARTRLLLRNHKMEHLPECLPNGNFKKMQCRDEMCYCVDENGLQLTKEVPRNSGLIC